MAYLVIVLLSRNMKVKTYGNVIVPVVFNGSFLDCLTLLNGADVVTICL